MTKTSAAAETATTTQEDTHHRNGLGRVSCGETGPVRVEDTMYMVTCQGCKDARKARSAALMPAHLR